MFCSSLSASRCSARSAASLRWTRRMRQKKRSTLYKRRILASACFSRWVGWASRGSKRSFAANDQLLIFYAKILFPLSGIKFWSFYFSVDWQFCSWSLFSPTSLAAVTSFKIFSTATLSKSPSVWWSSASSSGSRVFCGTRRIRKSCGRWIRASFSNLPNEKRSIWERISSLFRARPMPNAGFATTRKKMISFSLVIAR